MSLKVEKDTNENECLFQGNPFEKLRFNFLTSIPLSYWYILNKRSNRSTSI